MPTWLCPNNPEVCSSLVSILQAASALLLGCVFFTAVWLGVTKWIANYVSSGENSSGSKTNTISTPR